MAAERRLKTISGQKINIVSALFVPGLPKEEIFEKFADTRRVSADIGYPPISKRNLPSFPAGRGFKLINSFVADNNVFSLDGITAFFQII